MKSCPDNDTKSPKMFDKRFYSMNKEVVPKSMKQSPNIKKPGGQKLLKRVQEEETTKEKIHIEQDLAKFIQNVDSFYNCTSCSYSTKWRSNGIRHARKHSRSKPYKCDVCNSAFTDPSNFKAHMHRHTNTGFICKICGKVFSGKNNLSDHMHVHEKPTRKHSGPCLLPSCARKGEIFKDLLKHTKLAHNLCSIATYVKAIGNAYSVSTSLKECNCEEHYVWIYKYVGQLHNCSLCECSYKIVYTSSDGWMRVCRYRRGF